MFLLYSFHLIWYIFITIIKNYVWIFQVSFPPLASCVYIIYFSIIVVNFLLHTASRIHDQQASLLEFVCDDVFKSVVSTLNWTSKFKCKTTRSVAPSVSFTDTFFHGVPPDGSWFFSIWDRTIELMWTKPDSRRHRLHAYFYSPWEFDIARDKSGSNTNKEHCRPEWSLFDQSVLPQSTEHTYKTI
jgi:hypothetical protein